MGEQEDGKAAAIAEMHRLLLNPQSVADGLRGLEDALSKQADGKITEGLMETLETLDLAATGLDGLEVWVRERGVASHVGIVFSGLRGLVTEIRSSVTTMQHIMNSLIGMSESDEDFRAASCFLVGAIGSLCDLYVVTATQLLSDERTEVRDELRRQHEELKEKYEGYLEKHDGDAQRACAEHIGDYLNLK